jgi:hypothetical protein
MGKEEESLWISVFWAEGSVCGRRADNVVMRQVEDKDRSEGELETRRDFEKDRRKEKSK